MKKIIKLMSVFLFLFIFCATVPAQEFRTINPIPIPEKVPKGAISLSEIQPVSQEKTTSAVQEVFNAWNKGDVQKYLGPEFYDKTRLTDAVSQKVPKDAEVRILSIQGVQTLNQYQTQSPETGKTEIISTVSVTANTQIEFNDINKGYRKLEGTNEYILRIVEEVVQEK